MAKVIEYCNLQEENRCGYVISTKMKNIWNIQLEMLQKLIEVCQKYDLKIFAAGGTMLGAVRHKGYIPWDDDIDIDMLRPDYDKLLSIAAQEFKAPYFFQTAYSDEGYYRGHAQLRYDNTTAILKSEPYVQFNQGIFIDIFVLDALPSNLQIRENLIEQTQQILNFLWIRRYPHLRILHPIRLMKLYKRMKGKTNWSDRMLYKYFEDLFRKNSISESEEIAPLTLDPLNKRFYRKKEWYQDVIYMPFEYIQIPVSTRYEDILRKQYGPDYMTPKQAPTLHGDVILDSNCPYKEYLQDLKLSPFNFLLQKIKYKIYKWMVH